MVTTRRSSQGLRNSSPLALRSRDISKTASPAIKRTMLSSETASPSEKRRRKHDAKLRSDLPHQEGSLDAEAGGTGLSVHQEPQKGQRHGSAEVATRDGHTKAEPGGPGPEVDVEEQPSQSGNVNVNTHVKFNDVYPVSHEELVPSGESRSVESEQPSTDEREDDAPAEMSVRDGRIQQEVAAFASRAPKARSRKKRPESLIEEATAILTNNGPDAEDEPPALSEGSARLAATVSPVESPAELARAASVPEGKLSSDFDLDVTESSVLHTRLVEDEPRSMSHLPRARHSGSKLPPKSTNSLAAFRGNIFKRRKRTDYWGNGPAFVKAIEM